MKEFKSQLECLVQEMTYEQIKECGNIQGSDGTRGVPEEIRTKILDKMRTLNANETQDDNDAVFAFEHFWTIFDRRFGFLKEFKSKEFISKLEELKTKMSSEKYGRIKDGDISNKILRGITRGITEEKRLNKNEKDKEIVKEIVKDYYRTIEGDKKSSPLHFIRGLFPKRS